MDVEHRTRLIGLIYRTRTDAAIYEYWDWTAAREDKDSVARADDTTRGQTTGAARLKQPEMMRNENNTDKQHIWTIETHRYESIHEDNSSSRGRWKDKMGK